MKPYVHDAALKFQAMASASLHETVPDYEEELAQIVSILPSSSC